MTKSSITFVLPTYNRADLLDSCIQSIIDQFDDNLQAEVLVIDNNSTDNTHLIAKKWTEASPYFRLVNEHKQGLSHARNKAIEEANGDWVIYIDDDAKVQADYLKILQREIEMNRFDCFGGMYYAWFPYGKPKWIPDGFGDKTLIQQNAGPIDGSKGWLSGGNFIIKKSVFQEIGGFDTELGMKGKAIAYGEENDLQIRLLKNGYRLGFIPELAIDHAVLPHKLKLNWHLKNSFARGKYHQLLYREFKAGAILFLVIKSMLVALVKVLPLGFIKLITQKKYFIQNLVLDSCSPTLWYLGVLSAHFKKNPKA